MNEEGAFELEAAIRSMIRERGHTDGTLHALGTIILDVINDVREYGMSAQKLHTIGMLAPDFFELADKSYIDFLRTTAAECELSAALLKQYSE